MNQQRKSFKIKLIESVKDLTRLSKTILIKVLRQGFSNGDDSTARGFSDGEDSTAARQGVQRQQ